MSDHGSVMPAFPVEYPVIIITPHAVGSYAQKYAVGYRPNGFYYAGVDKDPSTYTAERVTGTVTKGPHNICRISRP
ncbi:hypothetical protein [Streptomyces sp. NPDC004042]|uniref:hypothetical protein n=1 Tax=Streptomyces sp. NPDC004042 TaxID=3154451 RepID=UPI0033BA538C